MADLRATLSSQGGTLDLAEISVNGKGLEAVAGATGFGLPPVAVEWLESAGDGATAVHSRVAPRELTIPLEIAETTYAALKSKLRLLSRVVQYPMTLTLIDPSDQTLTTQVVRVGGGDYGSGVDTNGSTWWAGELVLRAGDPYWNWSTKATANRAGAGTLSVDNPGSASAWPTWTVTGPLSRVNIATPGSTLEWSGELAEGKTLVLNTKAGTVLDGDGANRYDGIGPAPKFRTLPPGITPATVEFGALIPQPRINWFTNPRFLGNVSDWTNPQSTGRPVSTTIAGRRALLGDTSKPLDYPAMKVISGLSPGETMMFRVWSGGVLTDPQRGITGGPAVIVDELSFSGTGQFAEIFTVPSDGKLTVRLMSGMQPGNLVIKPYISELYIGKPGSYFDGTTAAAGGYSYAWEGTADASRSIETPPPVSGTPSLKCDLTPREWLVI